ncbi:ABC transporter permease [Haloarchaeobius sp. TZWWS8]|uniref:ABC transporter permease n=1 Tax=Haloarchaeobius sp. TZWWS8 TaxID=3446121 RepID=UPI003EBA6E19
MAKRELASLRSEKTIVLALLIQLFVASFSSFLVVGLVSLYDPGSVEGYELDMAVTGNASEEVLAVVADQRGIDPIRYRSAEDARAAFHSDDPRRRVDAVLVASYSTGGRVQVQATVPDENLRTTIVVVQVRDTLNALEERLRDDYSGRLEHEPVDVPPKQGSSPYFGFTYTVLVPLLLFLPVFISGSIAVDSLTEEIQRGTMELLRVAPVSLGDIVAAKLLATASLAPLQAILWLALLWVNGTAVENWGLLVGVVTGLSFAVVATGLSLSLLSTDRRQAQFLYSTGILGAITLAGLLPEHPANTIARLAIGSPGTGTLLFAWGYMLLGVVTYLGLRVGIGRVDAEAL